MKKSLYLAFFLAVICAIAGAALTAFNNITEPIIKEAAIAKEKANLELIYPGAEFAEVPFEDDTGLVEAVYEAKGKGYVFKCRGMGYSSNGFTFMIAFNNDGHVGGYVVLEHQETSGFGARLFEQEHINTIMSLSSSDAFPTLSGATLTSTGVVNGINAAKAIFNKMQGIEYDPNATAPAQEAKLSLGAAFKLNSDELKEFEAACEIKEDNGDSAVYACEAKGFGLLSDHAAEYSANKVEVTIDRTSKTVQSIVVTQFGDTEGIGTNATSDAYLETFKGAALDQDVNVYSGATYTSKSVGACAAAALAAEE